MLWTWLAFRRPFRRSALKDWPIDKPVAPADLWPATKVEMRPVADLIPYVRNARTHTPEQVAQIAASMRRFGFTMPMLVAEDGTVNPGAVARQFGVSIAQIRKLFDAS